MAPWFWYAIAAAAFYGAHQVFTRLASNHIGDALGALVVECVAAAAILAYILSLWLSGRWDQKFSWVGFQYSALTGICVGAGTVAFFMLFQRGAPLLVVPAILAGGAAIMAIVGILVFHEAASWSRVLGISFAVAGLLLLRR